MQDKERCCQDLSLYLLSEPAGNLKFRDSHVGVYVASVCTVLKNKKRKMFQNVLLMLFLYP